MECGGKRSATPLCTCVEVELACVELQSAVAALLCRRTPQRGTRKMRLYPLRFQFEFLRRGRPCLR
jgi:hypothetical protein